MIVDVHTHAFPDHLAARAMAQLQSETDQVTAVLDGTVSDLLRSMDRAAIDRSVVASIATRPAQFEPILRWSESIRSARIEPFPSLCPLQPDAEAQVRRAASCGFRGLKLHAYYQQFMLDDERLDPVYGTATELGLILLLHCGFDIAFPRERVADPVRLARVLDRFPRLTIIAAHLGGWMDWTEVELHLVGRPVYLDVSTSFDFIDRVQAKRILTQHPADRLLFGSDSPWVDQSATIGALRSFALDPVLEQAILGANAARLGLGLDVPSDPNREPPEDRMAPDLAIKPASES
jgi:uncharacterized protein